MKYVLTLPLAAIAASGICWWLVSDASQGDRKALEQKPASDGSPTRERGTPLAYASGVHFINSAAALESKQPVYAPITIGPCTLSPVREQDVSSQMEGVLAELHADLGSKVKSGACLAQLDDRKLSLQIDLLKIRASSTADEEIAKAQYDEANGRVEYALKANRSGFQSVSDLEYKTYVYQSNRFAHEVKKAREEREAAVKELERAEFLRDLHRIQAGISGEVVKVHKRTGEAVKPAEALFRVANLDDLRIEGFCKTDKASQLRVGMRVLIEPEICGSELTELSGHTGPITALAISENGNLIASASADRNVLLWDWPSGKRTGTLPHPAEVLAVDFAPLDGAGYCLLTGAGDSQVRIWSISKDHGRLQQTARLQGHDGAVRAVCFAPNGRTCATGGDDRKIGIWDVDKGQLLYWLQHFSVPDGSAHQGAITSLSITEEGYVVSAGRDNAIKVWKTGKTEASLVAKFSGRSGDVTQFSLSTKGDQLISDHGHELRILDLESGAIVGRLTNGRHGRFRDFALLSPSRRFVFTAANNGRLQLWKTPASSETNAFLRLAGQSGFTPLSCLWLGATTWQIAPVCGLANDRAGTMPQLWDLGGFELRHYIMPNVSNAKCALFAPDEKAIVTGGNDNLLRVWEIPERDEVSCQREGVVSYVGNQIEQGTDFIRIQAIMDNRGRWPLKPGTHVNLTLFPDR